MSQSDLEAEAPSPFRYRRAVPLRFADLDPLGHVNHLAYLSILETARVGYYFDVLGLRSAQEVSFVLAELAVRYRESMTLGQTPVVLFRVSWLKRSSSGFAFELRDQQSGRLLADGEGVQVFVNTTDNRSEPLPAEYVERLRRFEGDALASS